MKIQDILPQLQQNSRLNISSEAPLLLEMSAIYQSDFQKVVLVACSEKQLPTIVKNLNFLCNGQKIIRELPSVYETIYGLTPTDWEKTTSNLNETLRLKLKEDYDILVVSPLALIAKIHGLDTLSSNTQLLVSGASINRQDLLKSLLFLGYSKVNTVKEQGSFAVRGSVIDVFTPCYKYPVRVDLFGNEIESLKYFSVEKQTSIQKVEACLITPVKNIIFSPKTIDHAKSFFTNLADEQNYPTRKLNQLIHDIEEHSYFFGIEKLFPAFFGQYESLLDLVKNDNPIFIFQHQEEINAYIKNQVDHAQEAFQKNLLKGALSISPKHYFFHFDHIKKELHSKTSIDIQKSSIFTETHKPHLIVKGSATSYLRDEIKQKSAIGHGAAVSLLEPVVNKISSLHKEKYHVVLPCQNEKDFQQLKLLLKGINIEKTHQNPFLDPSQFTFKNHVHAYAFITPHEPFEGSILEEMKLAIISPNDIFGPRQKREGQKTKRGFNTTLSDLNENDYVTHIHHGVARFKGIVKLSLLGVESDYLLLIYKNEEKLYVPIAKINLIKRHQATAEVNLALDKLGSKSWSTKKSKAKAAILTMAQDLLKLYAKRQLQKRPPSIKPDHMFFEFENAFEFEPTKDQQKAIDAVVADMQKDTPMDRLICGDVGYGKTEVAMRASYLSVLSKKMVVILAPTTVLAQQHGITFKKRFQQTGANIEVLSRFQKPKETKEILGKLNNNQVDILIGTHRVLSADVNLSNLGLLVIDEEQRFGIKAKEQIKKIRSKVDILSMSATPIPRTMQMGYFGIRDLSIIETPPVDRHAIQTYVVKKNEDMIKEAVQKELERKGQVYFVHNKVSDIEVQLKQLQQLLPEARINVAHGQMPEKLLEERMISFINQEFDVLLCTTIIETGIDVPLANTMLVNHADEFGLSQLYQLRGRIGRGKRQAYAFLLVDKKEDHLSETAKSRLEILQKFSDLGSGFRIAQHDLEIRGAGDLLGKTQHGHMAAIGYDLYSDLMLEAVKELKGASLDEDIDAEVKLPISAHLPEKYCPDIHERMRIYQKLASAEDLESLTKIFNELDDVYGDLPDEVLALKVSSEIKVALKVLKALSLSASFTAEHKNLIITVALSDISPVDHEKVLKAMSEPKEEFKITPQKKIIQHVGISNTTEHTAILEGALRAIENIKIKLMS